MSDPHCSFIVRGRARPQGSKRLLGKYMQESSPHHGAWRSDVRAAALEAVPDEWQLIYPVTCLIVCSFSRPKNHYNKKGVKPNAPDHPITRSVGDVDKLARSILDSLTSILFNDDSQVSTLSITKRYCNHDEKEHCEISIIQHLRS